MPRGGRELQRQEAAAGVDTAFLEWRAEWNEGRLF